MAQSVFLGHLGAQNELWGLFYWDKRVHNQLKSLNENHWKFSPQTTPAQVYTVLNPHLRFRKSPKCIFGTPWGPKWNMGSVLLGQKGPKSVKKTWLKTTEYVHYKQLPKSWLKVQFPHLRLRKGPKCIFGTPWGPKWNMGSFLLGQKGP